MSIACGITNCFNEFKVNVYDVRAKQNSNYSRSKDKPIQEIVDELTTKYGNDVGKIVVDERDLKPNQLEDLKKEKLEKYGDLIHVAIKEELDLRYLKLKVEYSVGELIVLLEEMECREEGNKQITLYQCTEFVEGRAVWKELYHRKYLFTESIDLEYAARIFHLTVDQVHFVFEDSQEKIESLYSSELYKYGFKSINFIKNSHWPDEKVLFLARHLISDPDFPMVVKIDLIGKNISSKEETASSDDDRSSNDCTNNSAAPPIYGMRQLHQIVAQAQNPDLETQILALTQVRKLLSTEENPPINDVIKSGVLPILVEYLRSSNSSLQLEAAWALTNIASGTFEQAQAVVQAGAVPYLLDLLQSPNPNVCEQAVWALGNIICDDPRSRDYCIQSGIVESLLKFATSEIPLNFLRNVIWTIDNLCKNSDSSSTREALVPFLPVLTVLIHHKDTDILVNAASAFCHLTEGGNEQTQLIIDSGVVKRLVELLGHPEVGAQTAALKAIGNIVTGTSEQTQVVLENGVLNMMEHFLTNSRKKMTKEAVSFLSNITSGNKTQVQAVIDANLIPLVINLLDRGNAETRKKAAWVISNVAVNGTVEHALYMVDHNVIPSFCKLLSIHDTRVVQVVLDGLNNILKKAGVRTGEICERIKECEGLEKIKHLQNHDNEGIHKLVDEIINLFFSPNNGEEITAQDGDCSNFNKEAVVADNQAINNPERNQQYNETNPDSSQDELSSKEKFLPP